MLTPKEFLLLLAVIGVYGTIRLLPRILAGSEAFVSADYARQIMERDGVMLLDVRSAREFAGRTGHIPGAVNIPLSELRRRLAGGGALSKTREQVVIVICETDSRAAFAVRLLRRHGWANARVLVGGMQAWQQAGYPVASDPRQAG